MTSFKVTDSSLWSTGIFGESSSTASVHSFAATHTIVSSTQSELLWTNLWTTENGSNGKKQALEPCCLMSWLTLLNSGLSDEYMWDPFDELHITIHHFSRIFHSTDSSNWFESTRQSTRRILLVILCLMHLLSCWIFWRLWVLLVCWFLLNLFSFVCSNLSLCFCPQKLKKQPIQTRWMLHIACSGWTDQQEWHGIEWRWFQELHSQHHHINSLVIFS